MRRVPSTELELFILREFLSESECSELIERIEANRRPSSVARAVDDAYFRTNETTAFDRADPVVVALSEKLARLSGIDPSHGETMQGQRYDVGQEYKPHTDFFDPDLIEYEQHCTISGQRTWTYMIYLNDVPAGGATHFRRIDKKIRPERGKVIAWNNRLPDGQVNRGSVHHGMKVRSGLKYIVTHWYRERPYGLPVGAG